MSLGSNLAPLILASASPRRRVLLERTGFVLIVSPQEVDESPRAGERPEAFVERLALAKAEESLRALPGPARGDGHGPHAGSPVVVAADTVVVLEDRILGKPLDEANAREMLAGLGGTRHEVYTGWCVARALGERLLGVEVTRVWFKGLRTEEMAWYLGTGEWRDKAGAYGIQGKGAFLVARIEGSYSNVVGLPLAQVVDALAAFGVFPSPGTGLARAKEVLR